MSIITIGLGVSIFTVLFLAILFRYEGKREARFGERMRIRADVLVLKGIKHFHATLHYVGKDFFLQIMHYILHSLLRSLLDCMVRTERAVRNAMRVNKTLAKRAAR